MRAGRPFAALLKRLRAAPATLLKRVQEEQRLPPTVKEVEFDPDRNYRRRTRGAFGRDLHLRRSQYDVIHAVGGLTMSEHDKLVRQAMAHGARRAQHQVRMGWRPSSAPR